MVFDYIDLVPDAPAHIHFGSHQCFQQVFSEPQTIYGQFRARKCNIQHLRVFGDALFQSSKVRELSLFGHLVLREASDMDQAVVHGRSVHLHESTISRLRVYAKDEVPKVYLIASQITEVIEFIGLRGVVIVDQDSGIKQLINGEQQDV